jgi:pyruvate/2-oxoacid:ferredoxin oxidoreductase beta subunit
MMAHGIPYMATASVAYPDDFIEKFRKAKNIRGTKFIHVLSPCPPGWRIDPSDSIRVARMATLSRVFPLYEVEEGKTRINLFPDRAISVSEYLKVQGRFRYMDQRLIDQMQEHTDRRWEELLNHSEVQK